jgi:hypothetical protein
MPENHTGGVSGVRNGCSDGADTGIMLGGASRAGKWEMSGGRMSENSDARVKMGDCVGEGAMIRLVPALRAATRDCGVMSCEKATESQVEKR